MNRKILVISPGVLPLPPSLGGAVENMIRAYHNRLYHSWEFEYVSPRLPGTPVSSRYPMPEAIFHHIESINAVQDFHQGNNFELARSGQWPNYATFCEDVARHGDYAIIHIHNEGSLIPRLRTCSPHSKLILQINDELLSKMNCPDLKLLAQDTDAIISCSEYIRKIADAALLACDARARRTGVIYNFADTNRFDPSVVPAEEVDRLRRKLGLAGRRVILFPGRLIEDKGPHLALEAFRLLASKRRDVSLLLVGAPWYSHKTDSDFVTSLREAAADISAGIKFTGYVDHLDMPAYYALSDVVVVPSIWDDPSPFVAYEAQSMARPVVGSTKGGIPEIVASGTTGYCIDVTNAAAFCDCLDTLLASPNLAQQMGKAGRHRIITRFDEAIIARQVNRLYLDLLK